MILSGSGSPGLGAIGPIVGAWMLIVQFLFCLGQAAGLIPRHSGCGCLCRTGIQPPSGTWFGQGAPWQGKTKFFFATAKQTSTPLFSC